jgi:hypothetical protein
MSVPGRSIFPGRFEALLRVQRPEMQVAAHCLVVPFIHTLESVRFGGEDDRGKNGFSLAGLKNLCSAD